MTTFALRIAKLVAWAAAVLRSGEGSAFPASPARRASQLVEMALAAALGGCGSPAPAPSTTSAPPSLLASASLKGVSDERGRFREIYCAVLEARRAALPDYRPCEEALTRVEPEPPGKGWPVALGPSREHLTALFVPGIGWDCFAAWLQPQGTADRHVRQFGFDLGTIAVDSLSSSTANARQIREAVLRTHLRKGSRIVLVGYSKGAPDILETVAAYPEIRSRVAAVVSVAGAVGGSPLANDAEQSDLALLRNWPGARCAEGDGGGIESLRPEIRKAWLAQHPLPKGIRYYSLVALPDPANISRVLRPSYAKLARIDARNDSQVLASDEVIPQSALLGYLNADHWALAVPIARSHWILGRALVDRNAYPREALLEAILRIIAEDLAGGLENP